MKRLIAAALLVAASTAQAYFLTGNDLLKDIQSTTASDRAFAHGYIGGISDSMDAIAHCVPAGVTLGQLLDLVRAELVNSPSERHNDASIFVGRVLYRTWPCAKKGSSL
jgi:hypothetical protein